MFGLKIFVRVQTFRRVPPVLLRNFCHPGRLLPALRIGNTGFPSTEIEKPNSIFNTIVIIIISLLAPSGALNLIAIPTY